MTNEQFNKVISSFIERKFETNEFSFTANDDLRKLIKKNKVPHLPGVYIIYEMIHHNRNVVYIGKSGKIQHDGEFGDQMLNKRLRMKQNKETYRQEFFSSVVSKHKSKLEINWYVTCDVHGKNGILPGKAKADLMQAFYDDTGKLPKWNRSF